MPDEYTGGIGKEGVENLAKICRRRRNARFPESRFEFRHRTIRSCPSKTLRRRLAAQRFLHSRLDSCEPNSTRRTRLPKECRKIQSRGLKTRPRLRLPGNSTSNQCSKSSPVIRKIRKTFCFRAGLWARKKLPEKPRSFDQHRQRQIFLFGFRPQYRGQSLATFPLLFNAISN